MTAGIMSGEMIMLLLPGRTAENEKQERYQNDLLEMMELQQIYYLLSQY